MVNSSQQLLRVNLYVWLCLAFALLYFGLAHTERPFDAPIGVVASVIIAAVVSVGARTFIAMRPRAGEFVHWNRVFNYIDSVLVAVAIWATHGIESDLWLLYFALMTFAALYSTAHSKRQLDVTIVILTLLATLPHQLRPSTALQPAVYARLLATHLFFLIMVTDLARRLGEDAEARNAELVRLREQMASSEERARIAREVHDSLGHTMVSMVLRLELCLRLMDAQPTEAREILQVEIPALRGAWNEARDLAFHLRPWDVDIAANGFVAVLRERCRKFAERTGLIVQVVASDDRIELRQDRAVGLMRIVQEALTNAAKHAQATRISVTLEAAHDGTIVCDVADNGKGFDSPAPDSGVGLSAMRERAAALGGVLRVTSAPDRGATVTVTVPQ